MVQISRAKLPLAPLSLPFDALDDYYQVASPPKALPLKLMEDHALLGVLLNLCVFHSISNQEHCDGWLYCGWDRNEIVHSGVSSLKAFSRAYTLGYLGSLCGFMRLTTTQDSLMVENPRQTVCQACPLWSRVVVSRGFQIFDEKVYLCLWDFATRWSDRNTMGAEALAIKVVE